MGGFAWLACAMSKMESFRVDFVRRLATVLIILDSIILDSCKQGHLGVSPAWLVASLLSRIERIISVNMLTVGIPI